MRRAQELLHMFSYIQCFCPSLVNVQTDFCPGPEYIMTVIWGTKIGVCFFFKSWLFWETSSYNFTSDAVRENGMRMKVGTTVKWQRNKAINTYILCTILIYAYTHNIYIHSAVIIVTIQEWTNISQWKLIQIRTSLIDAREQHIRTCIKFTTVTVVSLVWRNNKCSTTWFIFKLPIIIFICLLNCFSI